MIFLLKFLVTAVGSMTNVQLTCLVSSKLNKILISFSSHELNTVHHLVSLTNRYTTSILKLTVQLAELRELRTQNSENIVKRSIRNMAAGLQREHSRCLPVCVSPPPVILRSASL
ncbi:hypothetical protein ILYODFUR_019279 [Ilyodon furcidens]|uniref:Uncharacterized protein n=1 Tax=Ilyodon furcidens TaxID=33524 RepID=A0ABV0VGV6_9TELE